MRWDNTVRYNLGIQEAVAEQRNPRQPELDDGDRNFSKGSMVTNRVDLLSEFDFVYQRKYGFRTSYAAWGDSPTATWTTPTRRPRTRWSTACRSQAR